MLDVTHYSLVLVLDTQVVLEGKPLDELPWCDLTLDGPILLLCTPRMLSEVDARKRDGRLGERARRFNRLVEPAVGSQQPTMIRSASPRVELALVAVDPIDWSALGDLDRDEGDDRIVAEALFARINDPGKLTMFSYDIRPRSAAVRHGLSATKPPEAWIYSPEPGPSEKDNVRLRQRIQELEATQPQISLEVQADAEAPLKLLKVAVLDQKSTEALIERILQENPRRTFSVYNLNPDSSYDRRYDDFEKKVRRYGRWLHTSLERLFNQVAIKVQFSVERVGARHVDLQMRGSGVALHDKLFLKDIIRPVAPRPEPYPFAYGLYDGPTIPDLLKKVPRHEVVFDPAPNRGSFLRLACEDFRQGRSFEKRLFAEIDPRRQNPAEVEASITAENLNGVVKSTLGLPFEVDEVQVADLIDLEGGNLLRDFRLKPLFEKLVAQDKHEELET